MLFYVLDRNQKRCVAVSHAADTCDCYDAKHRIRPGRGQWSVSESVKRSIVDP